MAITEQEAAKSSHTHLVMVIAVVCFVICVSFLFVGLRFWCRYIIGLSYWDDAAAVMALEWDVVSLYEGLFWAKMTFLLLYYKLVNQSRWRSAYLGTIIVVVLWNVCQILLFFLQCAPLEAIWNRDLKMRCIANRLQLAYVCAGINILTDIVVAILPLPVIWKLNLRLSQKLALSAVFGLGCFTITLAIIRIKWVEIWSYITWDIVRPQLWALAEVTSALVCACIPTFKPLLLKINGTLAGHKKRTRGFVIGGHGSDVEFNIVGIRRNEGYGQKPGHNRVSSSETSVAVEQNPWQLA
ncbi:integral membrane protein [Fusarium beomiforme]|uniref:Integral membrane protein n=1 Tax=Fusarium beomiforme TaxID=44412 RepID=A0A9P5ALH6_9HYPO|nr:integral membrane protein [Fusarium beomiforme]